MLDLWYKNSVFYCVDVETFMDSNGDGVGDFRGLTDRLDHLEALGVNGIWLTPYYPGPYRDNGYDVADFYGVDPRLGTLGDFVEFSRGARDRGMKVVIDLVVNHTSVDHPWFQSARSSRDSPYRDWYVWSDEEPEDVTQGVIFPGVQERVWTYDEPAGAWYMHRFYAHQPDLNIANPAVREEIQRIMGFWLELGVSGFRIDAVPFLVEYRGLREEPDRDPLLFLSELRDFLSWRRAGAILLAEANVPHDRAHEYFGGREFDADERMHLLFDFPLNQKIFLAFVRGDAEPIREGLRSRPQEAPMQAQWATFLRNHDELSLDKLSQAERDEVFDALAPRHDMRIYARGIRRRLAPMVGGDVRALAMLHSLLFALPGSPVLWYGDEIGMGEDLSLEERNAVRTPMQWSNAPSGGFSSSQGELVRPVMEEGPFGYPEVNVAGQRGEPGSLLEQIERMVKARRSCPEIGWGETQLLDVGAQEVLAMLAAWRGTSVLTLHNLSGGAVRVELALPRQHLLVPIVGSQPCERELASGAALDLEPYAYLWLRVDGHRR